MASAEAPGLFPWEEDTIAVFEAARGSVVSITTAATFRDPWTRRTQRVPSGSGSGFFWDEAGHIVTNDHVIAGASAAQIALADGRVFPAELVGRAPQHDLAVLRIAVSGEPPRPLPRGRSAGLRVGQSVFAIGNPFGLDWTLTTGVVSALDRELAGSGGATIRGLIQTDAAINPGNSGGPLIDSRGRLIGVNTAIYSPSGGNAGVGFAVPVDTVARVVPELIETGRYTPPFLGVIHDDRATALAHAAGLDGVLVIGVEPGSPADQAGLVPLRRSRDGTLVPGDTIVAVDGRPVDSSAELEAALDAHASGESVELEILREGRRLSLSLTLG
ncbi:MAG: trypsin-like peptidase domain-containing protein [Rhodobacteraceae bacterium]|nr:trypsin-like peptidase domain-containing protein [Paracoccaceae bacterium]